MKLLSSLNILIFSDPYPMVRERRSKLQIFYDVLSAIKEESQNNEKISYTRIQFKCNTSYDKLLRYFDEMKAKQLLKSGSEIEITEKGEKFYQDYSRINELIKETVQRLN
ncbi:MAG: hypothetical protein YK1309IOTA_470002 [Marine Group I thaumarchaeote]|nr:MAG: hypothetical protein YK1309IOTA_470002 [Marine Group I thaumarchaeote]